jgi:hypothetical protein
MVTPRAVTITSPFWDVIRFDRPLHDFSVAYKKSTTVELWVYMVYVVLIFFGSFGAKLND